jgi:hypothetical protein
LLSRCISGAMVFSVIDATARLAADNVKNDRLIRFRRFMLGPLLRDERTHDRAIARGASSCESMTGCVSYNLLRTSEVR